MLDLDAVRATQRLQARGFEAYLVGGCVRDLLLGQKPKDFDIATEARPTQVKRTFPRNCRIIGRRFKLAHLHFNSNRKILEVATFRTTPSEGEESDDLLITRDNEFGSAEEDAVRRDFTVNALFFDPVSDSIIDYAGGLPDVENRVLRTIGEPVVRFREDPVRILRAAKFAGRLGFTFDGPTYEAMASVAPDLSRSAPPRLLEEILRLLRGGHSLDSFQILRDIKALDVILPVVAEFLNEASREERITFWRMLEALDTKVLAGAEIPNPVLLGVLFAIPVRRRAQTANRRSWTTVAETVVGPFALELRLPRRDAGCLKRICGVQPRFTARGPKKFKTGSFLRDPYFEEAMLLFELSCMATGIGLPDLERWKKMDPEPFEPDGELDDGDDEAFDERDPAEAADSDRSASRSGRRRRGRRGRGGGRTGATEADAPEADAQAPARQASSKRAPTRQASSGQASSGQRGRKAKTSRRSSEDRPSRSRQAHKGPAKSKQRRGSKKSVQGIGRRDNTVETIEPESFDLSAFDVELDPGRVPTFGVIVEGQDSAPGGKKRQKGPKSPPPVDEDYRPPPPPTQDPGAPPPPPPPSSGSDDEFGDW